MNELSKSLVYVFVGGGMGSSIRFLISHSFYVLRFKVWTATLLVNVVGAAIMLFLSYKFDLSKDASKFYQVGILGGLTTFSTFSLEVVEAFKSGSYQQALMILGLNIILGIVVGIGVFR
jgi:CrcB protein